MSTSNFASAQVSFEQDLSNRKIVDFQHGVRVFEVVQSNNQKKGCRKIDAKKGDKCFSFSSFHQNDLFAQYRIILEAVSYY